MTKAWGRLGDYYRSEDVSRAGTFACYCYCYLDDRPAVGKIAEVVEVLDLAGDGSGEVGACAWAPDDDDLISLADAQVAHTP